MTVGDIIVIAVIALAAGLAIRSLWITHKNGGGCGDCGSCGSCGRCGGQSEEGSCDCQQNPPSAKS